MIPANNLRKGVLLFSTVLVGLLMWLSISFLLRANSDREDANHLTTFIETDAALRSASMALADERATSYWLTGIDGLFFAAESLVKPRSTTNLTLRTAIDKIGSNLQNATYASQLRFQPNHIDRLVNELEASLKDLSNKRDALAQDLKYPSELRDQSLQIGVLDFYSSMIEKLQVLRHGTGYISSNTSRETTNTLAMSDAAWQIGLSNQLLTALIEGYITSGSTARGDALSQVTALQNRIDENLGIIKRIDAYANIDRELHTHAVKLIHSYVNNYRTPVHRVAMAIANQLDSPYTNYDWKKAAGTLDEHTQNMLNRADDISRESVMSAQQRSIRNMMIDVILVSSCIFLMLCAYWIVRRMHYQATHDELTGLPNRRQFKTQCEEKCDQLTGSSNPVSLLKIDLHKFKAINDSFGQGIGDKLLQQFAVRLQKHVPTNAYTARLGGDEYAVLLPDTQATAAPQIAAALGEKMSGTYQIDSQRIQLTTCIGYACSPAHAIGSEALRKAADLALYEAKQTGPDTVKGYRPAIAKAFKERQQLERELSTALENGEFELHYQPQFDLENSVVEGVEALLRWRHPTRGMVSPFHFIPVAEDSGKLPAIGQWVINEAVAQAARWREECGLHLRMSVNVSAHQFIHGDLVADIQTALEREKLAPEAFEIEITESVAMAELDLVVAKLNALHELGIRIALDDFGTGYSSLSYLQDLPLDTLKIDRSFITKIDHGTRTQRLLLESIASMAKLLEFHTVAEGVETDRQLAKVKALGIDTVQGYYYSKPVSGADIPADVQAIDEAYGDGADHAAKHAA